MVQFNAHFGINSGLHAIQNMMILESNLNEKKQPRRNKPNLIALSKLFEGQRYLFWAKEYEEYERQQQAVRDGAFCSMGFLDEEKIIMQYWVTLDIVLNFPPELSDEEQNELWHSDKVWELSSMLAEIVNTYQVIRGAIDFEIALTKQIEKVLRKPRKSDLSRNLLTPQQYNYISKLIVDVDIWVTDEEKHDNLWTILLTGQREIDDTGSVSPDMCELLQVVLNQRKGVRKPRLYAPAILILLLAEFFEDYVWNNAKATMNDNQEHLFKKEHDSEQNYELKHQLITKKVPWKPSYHSNHFVDFVESVFEAAQIEPIGLATMQKLLKNRKRLNGKKLTPKAINNRKKTDFIDLIRLADLVKP